MPTDVFSYKAMLTWKSLDKLQRDDKNSDSQKIRSFYIKKYIHILPIYYFTMVVALVLPVMRFSDYSAVNYVMHILLLHGFHPNWINPFNLEWYIADLALWYLIAPLLHKVIDDHKKAAVAVVVSVIGCIGYTILANKLFGAYIVANDVLERYFHTFCFLNQLPGMLIGVYLYYLLNEGDKLTKKVEYICLAIIFAMAFIFFNLNKKVLPSSLIASLLFGILILLLNRMRDVAILKPIEWIGKHSLGIYLTHNIVIRCLSDWGDNIGWIMALMIVLAITFLVGYWTEKGNSYIGDHLMKLINVHK
jgi:peptidoglycan/LPS O-acetylase OafA/YrhL